jgi:HEAT repeat protein
MRRLSLLILTAILLVPVWATAAHATIQADVQSVRQMLTAYDNQDFSVFETDSLIDALIEIIENDPQDADYHEQVVASALVVLGDMHLPDTVDVFIGKLDEYTTTCLYWLGTFASADAVDAITGYLNDEDPSVRYEAASALATIPILAVDTGHEDEEEDEELATALTSASDVIRARLEVEEDDSVREALTEALEHIV